jgi:hypothetical protein
MEGCRALGIGTSAIDVIIVVMSYPNQFMTVCSRKSLLKIENENHHGPVLYDISLGPLEIVSPIF